MAAGYDIAVDFMDMTEDRRLWTRSVDARAGVDTSFGRYVVVGDDDADPRVARIIARDAEGNIELQVLPAASSHTVTSSPRPDPVPGRVRTSSRLLRPTSAYETRRHRESTTQIRALTCVNVERALLGADDLTRRAFGS